MKRSITLLAAACFLAGGTMLTVAENPVAPADKAVRAEPAPAFPAGITQKDLNAASAIEKSLANIAEDGLAKNGFDNLIGYLVDQDRVRMADRKNMKVDDLNDLAAKIHAALKTKFGKDFETNKDALQNTMKITTGEVENTDALVGKWPVDAAMLKPNEPGAQKVTAEDAKDAKKAFGGDVNLEKGRKVAIVTIPRSHGRAGVTASMIAEATAWRLDVPNNITADQLHTQLRNGLKGLAEQTTWPDDYTEAQRLVTHVIIGSIYGVDMSPKFDNLKTAGEK